MLNRRSCLRNQYPTGNETGCILKNHPDSIEHGCTICTICIFCIHARSQCRAEWVEHCFLCPTHSSCLHPSSHVPHLHHMGALSHMLIEIGTRITGRPRK